MKFIQFPQVTSILAKDQPEYTPIPVHCKKKIGVFTGTNGEAVEKEYVNAMICCLELTDEQINELIKTKRIWYQQLLFGNNFQPMFISTKDPFIEENKQHWPADD